jgi:hypothetical protein
LEGEHFGFVKLETRQLCHVPDLIEGNRHAREFSTGA